MPPEEEQFPDQVRTALQQCFTTIRLARATELARSNHFLEAEALLSPNGELPENLRELDLLARIAAHQRHFARARRLWRAVLEKEPTNEAAKAALARLTTPWVAFAFTKRLASLSAIAFFAILAIVGILAIVFRFPQSSASATNPTHQVRHDQTIQPRADPVAGASLGYPEVAAALTTNTQRAAETLLALRLTQSTVQALQRTGQEQATAQSAALQTLQSNQNALLRAQADAADRIAALSQSSQESTTRERQTQQILEFTRDQVRSLAAAFAAATQAATNPPASLTHPAPFSPKITGMTITAQGDALMVRFDSGLFDRDTHFKPGSKALLASAARALVQTQEKLKIEIIGLACQESPTWPWSKSATDAELGLARALRVNLQLQSLGIFPPDTLTARAGLPKDLPFPNQSRDNRTVVLRISRQ